MKVKRGIVLIIFILIIIFAKSSYSKQESTYIINDIKYVNKLKNSNLSVGMEIKIPSY